MNPVNKPPRTPLLQVLQKAFNISAESRTSGIPAKELIGMHEERSMHRRSFIGNMIKAGAAVGTAGLLDACSKVTDYFPGHPDGYGAHGLQPKIVIVGAGLAGLNCAYQLSKAGYQSSVYEGATRTGGRIFSKRDLLAPGLYTELGGEFIDSEHKEMLKLCKEFGLPLVDTLAKDEISYFRDSFYINGRFYSEAEVINAFQPYAARISADIDSLPDDITYDDYDAASLRFDRLSVKAYLDLIGMQGFIREGIETAYLTEYGLETDIQSSINFLYLFSPDTSKGFKIFGSSDERYKIDGGNQTLTNALYSKVKNNVFLEHRLVKIKKDIPGYSLYFADAKGSTQRIKADIVVLTVPFSVLREVELDLPLPSWKANAIQRLGYGTNAKLLLGFDKRVWKNYNYSGYVFTDDDIQSGWDNSWAQPGKKGGFTVYQGGVKGIELGMGTPESQAPRFVSLMEKMWPGSKDAFNGTVKRMHWPTYPFTKGSYACYTTGQYTSIRGAEIKPVGNVYFAGEHCSKDYQGFMNGAAETGKDAADSIKKAIRTGQLHSLG